MTTFEKVNPEEFVNISKSTPEYGRGAWSRAGIGFEYRYAVNPVKNERIGKNADRSLDYWAVAAGSHAIASRLVTLGYLDGLDPERLGVYNRRISRAVRRFQSENMDPDGDSSLYVDGIVGRSDARALFTPVIRRAERKWSIPNKLLLGETNHESAMDPGAIGYFIFYPDYRGVDRGMSQINSKANPQVTWADAFDPNFSIDWSARRLRSYFDSYRNSYPRRDASILWDAAVCAHNNPSAANKWAEQGYAPTEAAAKYVASVKNAIY